MQTSKNKQKYQIEVFIMFMEERQKNIISKINQTGRSLVSEIQECIKFRQIVQDGTYRVIIWQLPRELFSQIAAWKEEILHD
jgi:16S rRNA U1498 N3-methylase RsmE